MTDSVAHASAEGREQEPRSWAGEQYAHFLDDVIRRPTIGPLASWAILGLVALVVWLTAHYSAGAAVGAACAAAEQRDSAAGGAISVNAGYGAVIAVTAITLMAGAQPVLEKRLVSDWSARLNGWFARRHWALRAAVTFVFRVLASLFQIPARVLSFADYLLARPIALIAGAGLSPSWLRYGVFLLWMAAAIVAAWRLPPPLGLLGFLGGVALVIGVVRRWNWVEADREAFFVARRQRTQIERIGFAEDLRDEALVGLAFLFVLIPLGLRQVELMRPETFCIDGASGADAGVLAWLGFFGAELAKSVPFVDWSEVFHVANGSPIEPNTALGAQVVFGMRATLDLLMIAAVVQAVQLASRLAEQNIAFAAGDIDILEPFVERIRLHALGRSIDRASDGNVVEQRDVAQMPPYSPVRLDQIVKGCDDRHAVQASADPVARRAALALAAKQALRAGRPIEVRSLIVVAARDTVEANRRLALRLQHELEPNATMLAAYARAVAAKTGDAVVDADVLVKEFPAEAHALARRAINSALNKLDVMVRIPAGEFVMGSSDGTPVSTELPRHRVRIATFELGKYPVTFDEFDVFCAATGYWRDNVGQDYPEDEGWGRGRRPTINVSWHDAKAYIGWLNSWTGGGFRLPSEAEWEYACRAGTATRWSFGDDEALIGRHAWFEDNSNRKTHGVGHYPANAFGLHDMHGNVSEWVEDPWHDNYDAAPNDGSVWNLGGDISLRVHRGGSFLGRTAKDVSSSARLGYEPSLRSDMIGFRLARTLATS